VDIGDVADLIAHFDDLGWSEDLRARAFRIHGVEGLCRAFLAPEPETPGRTADRIDTTEPARPDPNNVDATESARPDRIDVARAQRAMDIAHTGASPGPAPRSPVTTRPIPAPPAERLALARRPDGRIVRPKQPMTKALIQAGKLDHDEINARPRTPLGQERP
jgi:hypothetical protein